MKVCLVGPEMVPFAKTGGLGDVVGALPKALGRLGHDVTVFMPLYRELDFGVHRVHAVDLAVSVPVAGSVQTVSLRAVRQKKHNVEIYFIGNRQYFDRDGFYVDPATGKDHADNDERFIFFNRAVLEVLKALNLRPHVINVNDWQTALIPVYLRTLGAADPFFAGVKTVLTIHNLAYQGSFPRERFARLELPGALFAPAAGPFEFYGQVNFLKAGITFADKITTVSKQYAREIQTAEFGAGLEGVLAGRAADLVGIQNGVDYTVWSPSRDKKIHYTYHLANLSGKRMNKVELLNRAGLPIRDSAPLIGIISRLVDQKGFDLIAEAADRIFAMNLQMIILGTGETRYHDFLTRLQAAYPDKVRAYLMFDDTLAHQIEAAADIFLMPSRFEPSGLNQLYSLKYGTVPIVRRVGGLADTVTDYDPATGEGTGFVFDDYTAEALTGAIARAVLLFERKRVWTKVMKRGMAEDYSWQHTAEEYARLYRDLVS
ncbi:MAG TPA: glycogen synthase GlgA [candidate division Zixibacteria bacterium]|nr:glycogen synthase GlgA [candidate division Zixibacteria bacterium]